MYVNNKDLYREIIISKAMGKLTKDAEKMLYLIGKNVIKKFYYKDLDDRDDCLQNGMYQVYKNWYQFNEEKTSNAFAYYTEIFKRGFAASWKEVNKGRDITTSMTMDDGNMMNI